LAAPRDGRGGELGGGWVFGGGVGGLSYPKKLLWKLTFRQK
jgi:hypothetical protein